MSISIDYFFNSDQGLAELGRQINDCLGCSLKPYEGDADDLYARFLGMEFSLSRADGYVNDRELDFQSFGFELGFRPPWPDADLRPTLLPAMLVVVYTLHRRLGITGMLVYDVQRLLARYEEQPDPVDGARLFDVVSGRAVEPFASHLHDVETRLPT